MQLGFVMQPDAAPHDDRRLWPDLVDRHRRRRPVRTHLVSLDVGHFLELARFLELTSCLEMSPVSVAPVVARLEKMRSPNFILPSVITSLRQVRPVWGGHPAHPTTRRDVGGNYASKRKRRPNRRKMRFGWGTFIHRMPNFRLNISDLGEKENQDAFRSLRALKRAASGSNGARP